MTTNKPEQHVAGPEYQPTAQETSVLSKHFSGKTDPTAPRMKVLEDGKSYLPNHPDKGVGYALIMEAAGTTDFDFIAGLVEQLANASSQRDQLNEGDLNFMLAVVKEVKPRDQIEAMLAAQMAAVHMATMKFARRLADVETIQEQDSAERAFNKLVRTFPIQMEALKRYRTGGEPQVTVQNVSVSEGGQAIVGNITQAPREAAQDKTSP